MAANNPDACVLAQVALHRQKSLVLRSILNVERYIAEDDLDKVNEQFANVKVCLSNYEEADDICAPLCTGGDIELYTEYFGIVTAKYISILKQVKNFVRARNEINTLSTSSSALCTVNQLSENIVKPSLQVQQHSQNKSPPQCVTQVENSPLEWCAVVPPVEVSARPSYETRHVPQCEAEVQDSVPIVSAEPQSVDVDNLPKCETQYMLRRKVETLAMAHTQPSCEMDTDSKNTEHHQSNNVTETSSNDISSSFMKRHVSVQRQHAKSQTANTTPKKNHIGREWVCSTTRKRTI